MFAEEDAVVRAHSHPEVMCAVPLFQVEPPGLAGADSEEDAPRPAPGRGSNVSTTPQVPLADAQSCAVLCAASRSVEVWVTLIALGAWGGCFFLSPKKHRLHLASCVAACATSGRHGVSSFYPLPQAARPPHLRSPGPALSVAGPGCRLWGPRTRPGRPPLSSAVALRGAAVRPPGPSHCKAGTGKAPS